jgi:hypothetical protein
LTLKTGIAIGSDSDTHFGEVRITSIPKPTASRAESGRAERPKEIEPKERVRSGITSAELNRPDRRLTVNLAPAELRKEGSGFDLPIALAVLAASRQVSEESLRGHAAVGELALDGRVRPVAGVLAAAEGAREQGLSRLFCAAASAPEAALAGIEPVPLHHLAEAAARIILEVPSPNWPPSRGARAAERSGARPPWRASFAWRWPIRRSGRVQACDVSSSQE